MKYWLLAIYGCIAGIIILAVLYFLDTPIKPFFNSAWTAISGAVSNLNFAGLDIGKLISDNILGIAGFGATAVTTLIGVFAVRAKQKANEEILEANKQLQLTQQDLEAREQTLKSTVTSQGKVIEMYAEDTTADQLNNAMAQMQSEYVSALDAKDLEIQRLNRELQETKENAVTPAKIDELLKSQKEVA